MTTQLELSLPLDCTLETEHELTPKDMNRVLEAIEGIATVKVLDEKYYEVAERKNLKQVAVDGVVYQYLLIHERDKLVDVKDISDILEALRTNNFEVRDGIIYYFNETIAKLNILGRWVQFKKEMNELNVPLIYSFPDTFRVFQLKYSTTIKKLKELVSIGQLEINHELWECKDGS